MGSPGALNPDDAIGVTLGEVLPGCITRLEGRKDVSMMTGAIPEVRATPTKE